MRYFSFKRCRQKSRIELWGLGQLYSLHFFCSFGLINWGWCPDWALGSALLPPFPGGRRLEQHLAPQRPPSAPTEKGSSPQTGTGCPAALTLLKPVTGFVKHLPMLLGEWATKPKQKLDMSHWTLSYALESFETCYTIKTSTVFSVYDIWDIFVHECTCLPKGNNWCPVPKECCACLLIKEMLPVWRACLAMKDSEKSEYLII